MVKIGGSGRCNNRANERVLNVLKAIQLSFRKTLSTLSCSSQASSVQIMCQPCDLYQSQEQGTDATEITDVVEVCTSDSRNLVIEVR